MSDAAEDALVSASEVKTREDFYAALQTLREASGLTVAQIANRAGISEAAARSVLRGRYDPSPLVLHRVLLALGLSLPEILSWGEVFVRVVGRPAHHFPVSGTTEAERDARRELSQAESELTDSQELTLPALWKATHARLDYYHQIATGQAKQSFRNAQIAMAVGFALLVVFAVLALLAQTTTGAIVTGALGATSAAFAAYIGRTFVRSQETAATHLRSYFDQPLEFSRYLAAERLLNSLDRLDADQRATITADVLRGMLPSAGDNGAEKPSGGDVAS